MSTKVREPSVNHSGAGSSSSSVPTGRPSESRLRTRRSQVRVLQGAPTSRCEVGHAPQSLAHLSARCARRTGGRVGTHLLILRLPRTLYCRPPSTREALRLGRAPSPRSDDCDVCICRSVPRRHSNEPVGSRAAVADHRRTIGSRRGDPAPQ